MRAPLCLLLLLTCACTALHAREGGAARRVASFDGLEIAYEVAGEGSPALVFVHGWCGNRGHWRASLEAFRGEHSVVALDLGGHGDSGKQRGTWSLPDLARDVQAVVEHENLEQVILVGHSMGGPVSLMAAANMPERVIGVVGADTLHTVAIRFTPELLAQFLGPLERDYAGFFDQFVREGLAPGTDPAVHARICREAVRTPLAVAAGLMRSYEQYDPAATLGACPVPVWCINSSHTLETDVVGNRAVQPDFHVVLLESAYHFPMLEDPLAFDARLREVVAALSRH